MKQTFSLAALAVVLAAGTQGRAADDVFFYYDVTLKLQGAVFPGDDVHDGKDLELCFGYRDGRWDPHIMGWAGGTFSGGRWDKGRALNSMDHEGQIASVEDHGDRVRIVVEMVVHPDPWVPGGAGRYVLDLERDGTNYAGSFEGSFNGKPVKGRVSGRQREDLWPSPVAGVEPFEPGEHPRLIFRRGDLAALKRRMETPEGRAMLDRLRALLGGDDMPTVFNRATQAYGGGTKGMPIGEGYTLWHGMGFGFLYQVTGETKYADLARRCVEKAREGVRDRDQRYSYVRPGGKLRAGSSFAAIAHAYDFCYEAWPEAYRRELAREIQDKVFAPGPIDFSERAMAEPVDTGLVFKTGGGQHSPLSNHYMAWNGGGGTAILGVWRDPGTDDETCRRSYRVFLQRGKRALEASYGSRGFFYEGHHCGRLNTNTGFSSFIQAMRVALGRDLVASSESGQWLLTKWIYEIVRFDGRLNNPQRGMYASPRFDRMGHSSGGDFSQGFGLCPEAHRPAVLWFYNHVICPGPEKDYDALVWPHRAVYAFVNWPLGVDERNPAEVLSRVLFDEEADYYVFRTAWEGEDDIVVTSQRGNLKVLGKGLPGQADFHTPLGPHTCFREADGAAVMCTRTHSLAFDYSGASGVPALFVLVEVDRRETDVRHETEGLTKEEATEVSEFVRRLREKMQKQREKDAAPPPAGRWEGVALKGPRGAKTGEARVGRHTLRLLLLTRSEDLPAVRLDGEGDDAKLVVGRRTLWCDGEKLCLGRAD